MQRPRRTTEIQEEPSTATKRNSRTLPRSGAPSPAPNTGGRYTARQSRIARPSSSDRQSQAVPFNSALRGTRTTPQRTPTPSKTPTTRVLFTAEKERNAHNDKRWVQEKAQQIVEHLRATAKPGAVHGLPPEFFARSGCLRLMSTKQFVAIVNYFLHHIWGSRFTVGANHIDDIINILQKLQYPHQVNKSWLKTPNTQHSFGYVIQLFDFFMDFVVPENEEHRREMQFPLQEPQELSQSVSEDQLMQIPDSEFQAILLRHSEEGFFLWDKQLMEEFGHLQQQTCDFLISKRCGLDGVAALDEELDKLIKHIDVVQNQRPIIRRDVAEHCQKLEQELKDMQQKIQIAQEDNDVVEARVKEEQELREWGEKEVRRLEEEVKKLQKVVHHQPLRVDQRDQLVEERSQLKYTIQIQERTQRELQDRLHHEQVILSRNKKKLTDLICSFNDQMREIAFTLQYPNIEELQLPLNPQPKDLNDRIAKLKQQHTRMETCSQKSFMTQQQVEKQISELTHKIATKIEPKYIKLNAAYQAAEKNARIFEQRAKEERSELDSKLKDLEERKQNLRLEVQRLQELKGQKQKEVDILKTENENLMFNTEQNFNALANEREARLDQYENSLEEARRQLTELEEFIEKGDKQIQQLKKTRN